MATYPHPKRLSLLISLLSAALLLAANIFVFAPYVVYRSNSAEFEVGYFDMLASTGWFALALLVLVSLPGLTGPRAFLRRYIPVIFVLGVLTWFQSNMLMWDYGVFDGRPVSWDQYDLFGWLDAALWLLLLALALRYSRQVLRVVNYAAWLLLIGQFMILGIPGSEERTPEAFWHRELPAKKLPQALLEMSTGQNIFHLVLDSFQTDVFQELLKENDAFGDFAGFTLFGDNAAVSPHTSFAMPAILSGQLPEASQSPAAWYQEVMASGFHDRLYRAGYTVNLVPLLSMASSRHSNYFEIPSNYQGTAADLRRLNAAQLMDVALFRVAPHFLRKVIYDRGNWWLLRMARLEIAPPSFQAKAFFADYVDGLKLGSASPAYHFLHLNPPHPPYTTLADGHYAGRVLDNTRENYLNEARAIFLLLRDFLATLRSLDIYDDSMIIVQGDHGSEINPLVDGQEIQPCLPRLAALLVVKPFSAGDQALETSHAPTTLLDIAPTVLEAIGIDGRSVFEVDGAAPRSRPFVVLNEKGDVTQFDKYIIEGSVLDPGSCTLRERVEVVLAASRYELGSEIQFGMAGNAEPYQEAGWTSCLVNHCWTDSHHPTLRIPVAAAGRDLVLTVKLIPYLNRPQVPQQRIGLKVNGQQVSQWLAANDQVHVFTARIPGELVTGDEMLIGLDLPDAASPMALGLGGDVRLLGVAMISLSIALAAEAVPPG